MIEEFLYKYYIDPVRYNEPYNPVETITYAALFIVVVFLLYRWLKKTGMTVDGKFVLATIPYVVLGGVLRVVQDTGVITSDWQFLLTTPLIYCVIFIFTAAILCITWELQIRKMVKDYLYWYAGAGTAASICVGIFLTWFGLTHGHLDLVVFFSIMALACATAFLVWAFMRYVLKWEYLQDRLYQILIFGQMLDASATSYGIDLHPLHYYEQHVVGGALISWTNTAFVMFPLKLVVLFPAIYVLQMYRKEAPQALWHIILLAMIVVGLAPGIRDMVRMILYV